jgi:enoyl-CoA hydratase
MAAVLTERRDAVGIATLNRPEARNALNGALLSGIRTAMAELDADGDVAVVILTGADPAFCAGLDLKQLGASRSEARTGGVGNAGGGPWSTMGKPVIGAVNGPAVTGGLEIALQCDFLVASERARFADTHARVGLLPGWGLSVLLPQAVGIRKAREMSLTGAFLGADDALRFGLVNHVVAHDELLPTCGAIAAAIASADQRAARALLAEYRDVTSTTVADGLRIESERAAAWNTAGAMESVAPQARRLLPQGRDGQ